MTLQDTRELHRLRRLYDIQEHKARVAQEALDRAQRRQREYHEQIRAELQRQQGAVADFREWIPPMTVAEAGASVSALGRRKIREGGRSRPLFPTSAGQGRGMLRKAARVLGVLMRL